jgi:hypothetical protein
VLAAFVLYSNPGRFNSNFGRDAMIVGNPARVMRMLDRERAGLN